MYIKVFQVGPFQSNCIVLSNEKTKEAVVIDPGDEADEILRYIKASELKVSYILLTHGHIDHIAATHAVWKKTKAKLVLHPEDKELYGQLVMQAQMFGVTVDDELAHIDIPAQEGVVIDAGTGLQIKVLHTPGHSPGSVCFLIEEFYYTQGKEEKNISLLLSGDTLFQGSIGRTDLWGGNYDALISSVKQKIFTLPDSTLVISGHGPITYVGVEKASNPFFI